MNDLDRSIAATLAYHGSFGWPLTLVELKMRLIPAARLGGKTSQPAMSDILERLEIMQKIGTVTAEHGLYALMPATESFVSLRDISRRETNRRIEQEKIWAQKWRHMLRRAWWLQAVPFVRALFASGSLAMGNMSETSDWDVFVVAQADRLYTARTCLLFAAWLMRALRTKKDTVASDKFCFNHYVTTDGLEIVHRSLYVAHGLALMVPVMDRGGYAHQLAEANEWMQGFLPPQGEREYVRRSVRHSRILSAVRRILEIVLNAWPERMLRAWQQRRIARTPATHEKGGRIIADNRELEFHPRSFEVTALARYRESLTGAGLSQYAEQDSGLR